jgi:hypothetical protein
MSKSYTLMFTLKIPSSGPYLGKYSSPSQIVVDLTSPNNSTLPTRELDATGDINIKNAFPANTTFLIISYDGPQIYYYDNNGNSVDLSNPLNISKVAKVVAGISNSPPSSDSSSSNVGLILGIVFGLIILGGIGVGAYFYMSNAKPTGDATPAAIEESKTGGYFMKGE